LVGLIERPFYFFGIALHELDPAFRKITLENQRLKDLVTDLKFHKDPVGTSSFLVCFNNKY
jgi:hypothetical protein